MVRWLVSRGYSRYTMVSWVSGRPRQGFEDYMRDGIFAALEAVEEATGVQDPNCVGYCISGTLASRHPRPYMAAEETPDQFGHLLGRPDGNFSRSRRAVGVRG